MSTKVIETRSMIERGRSAERMPTGIESESQRTAPPKTSDAVTGASLPMIESTLWRLTNDWPSEPWRIRFQTKSKYCCQIGWSRCRKCADALDVGWVALAGRERFAGSAGITQEDQVRDDRRHEEQEDGPEDAPDEELRHLSPSRVWGREQVSAGRGAEAPLQAVPDVHVRSSRPPER